MLKEQTSTVEEYAAALRKGNPEVARLQRDLDSALAESRELREKLSRAEEEMERTKSRLEGRQREVETEKIRLEEQVIAVGWLAYWRVLIEFFIRSWRP
jgi:hypothetical protein